MAPSAGSHGFASGAKQVRSFSALVGPLWRKVGQPRFRPSHNVYTLQGPGLNLSTSLGMVKSPHLVSISAPVSEWWSPQRLAGGGVHPCASSASPRRSVGLEDVPPHGPIWTPETTTPNARFSADVPVPDAPFRTEFG